MTHVTALGVLVIDLKGEAGPVHKRATEIEQLAIYMSDAGVRIRQIASGEAKGLGYSMDEIRNHGDGLAGDLEQAAERYERGGAAYKGYAVSALDGLKPQVDTQVTIVEEAWQRYLLAKEKALAAFGTPAYPPLHSLEILMHEAYLMARDVTYQGMFEDWRNTSSRYSAQLFEASQIMEDGFWLNLLGAIDWVTKASSAVALAAGLVAIVFPPAAVVSIVAAGVSLVGTAVLAASGQRTSGDVGWAIVGVLPLAKLGKVASASLQAGRQSMMNTLPRVINASHGAPGMVEIANATRIAQASLTGGRAGAGQLLNETIWQVTKPIGQAAAITNARNSGVVLNGMLDAGQSATAVNTLRNSLGGISFPTADAGTGWLGARAAALNASGHPIAATATELTNTVGRRSFLGTMKGIDDAFKGSFKNAVDGMNPAAAENFRNAFFGQMQAQGGVSGLVARSTQSWLEQPWATTTLANGHESMVNIAKGIERTARGLVYLEGAGVDVTPGFNPSDISIRNFVNFVRSIGN